jgi:hypothetical protein
VTDADPEDEIRYEKAPHHGAIQARDSNAFIHFPSIGAQAREDHKQQEANRTKPPPGHAKYTRQQVPVNLFLR